MVPESLGSSQDAAPIIAVLVHAKECNDSGPDFGSIHTFCREMFIHARQSGLLLYIFTLKGITDQGVHGYFLEEDMWVKKFFPFPHVVYNRLHSRRAETGKRFSEFMKLAEKANIQVFNNRFLNKWEVHQFLSSEQKLSTHLPETCLFSRTNLEKMLPCKNSVFIKPIHGSQGRKIIKLVYEDGIYRADFSAFPGESKMVFTSLEEVFERISLCLGKQHYIIQQGIPLLTLNGRTTDFRVLCHRGKNLSWGVTSTVARLSEKGHFVANLARGGESIRPMKALFPLFGIEKAKEIAAHLNALATHAAECVSAKAPGLTGELGVDIGADIAGDLWIIEVNSKPSKDFEVHATKVRPSAKAIIECSQGLFHNQPR
ncbi:YheC/YheD family protein [Mesobacillus zeae]|nr:YheC/YheD family protein [Mesobacillus zeae]